MSTTEGKGQQEETIEIKKNIVIDASPEVVFKAITDPNELTNWFPDQAVLEPKVGGKMKFSFYKKKSDESRRMDYFPEGTIIEFIPNKKLSYTWEHPNIPDFPRTVVTWELEKTENNKTTLKLSHTGFRVNEGVDKLRRKRKHRRVPLYSHLLIWSTILYGAAALRGFLSLKTLLKVIPLQSDAERTISPRILLSLKTPHLTDLQLMEVYSEKYDPSPIFMAL